jgi:hypothetical protein
MQELLLLLENPDIRRDLVPERPFKPMRALFFVLLG